MKSASLLLLTLAALVTGCGSSGEDTSTITIMPIGNYALSDITISRESDDTNYATESTIFATTSYDVPPGYYYVYLEYMNLDTMSTGWWQTTDDRFTVAAGDTWVVEYGFDGGTVRKR